MFIGHSSSNCSKFYLYRATSVGLSSTPRCAHVQPIRECALCMVISAPYILGPIFSILKYLDASKGPKRWCWQFLAIFVTPCSHLNIMRPFASCRGSLSFIRGVLYENRLRTDFRNDLKMWMWINLSRYSKCTDRYILDPFLVTFACINFLRTKTIHAYKVYFHVSTNVYGMLHSIFLS